MLNGPVRTHDKTATLEELQLQNSNISNIGEQDRALSFFLSLLIYIYIYSRMGALGSPNSTFYNSWAPLLRARLCDMANCMPELSRATKRYVIH